MAGLRDVRRERRRRRDAAQAPPGPVRDYLLTPSPSSETRVDELHLLAVDVETTGLDPARDRVLSVGLVPVDGRSVRLGGARRLLVRTDVPVGDSAVHHGLTDDAVAALGVPPVEALTVVLEELRGRVLLAHHATIEAGFLAQACERAFGAGPDVPVLDTLVLQRHLVTSGVGALPDPVPGALRLWAARERYGLPVYRAHEALTDALACAELYLAQVAELEARRGVRPRRPLTLGHLRRLG